MKQRVTFEMSEKRNTLNHKKEKILFNTVLCISSCLQILAECTVNASGITGCHIQVTGSNIYKLFIICARQGFYIQIYM